MFGKNTDGADRKVVILDELEDVECLEGDTVTFRCRISPSDYAGAKWYLDETLLYTNELNEIQVLSGGFHTLTFKQLARKDTGTISFAAGDKRSYASLLVRERRPTICKSLEDCEAIEGGGLILSCVTSKPCHILWYKDGCLMWNSSRYFTSRLGCEARLTIREVCQTDAGVYECSAGSVTTRAAVTVKGTNRHLFVTCLLWVEHFCSSSHFTKNIIFLVFTACFTSITSSCKYKRSSAVLSSSPGEIQMHATCNNLLCTDI
uniref:Ig-like domain-containing protein n=2 Tax=Oreochromis TaxID=8139 RepID=A0A669BXW9_ORENI